MPNFFKYHKFSILIVLSGIALYFSFAYQLDRSDFIKLISLYAALFFLSFKLISLEKSNFWFLAGIALLFRLVFILSLPNLSQDFYRFIWDGRLILEGVNPYLSVPNEFSISIGSLKAKLIEGMGSLSAGNFTSYPPINQLFFAISAFFGGKSILETVVGMRMFIILADFGTLYFGRKLLQKLDLPPHRIFWFILNPFIIIELTGNLHFEGVMLFFLVWSLYLLHHRNWIWSAVLLGISVSVKLLPLLFLPLLWNYFTREKKPSNPDKKINQLEPKPGKLILVENREQGFKKLLIYYIVVSITILLSFLPFLSATLISNFSSSIALWFQKFEFNASIYYVIRWIGFQFTGYNIIGTAGKILPLVVLLIIASMAFFRKNNSSKKLMTAMLLAVSVYLFLSTTVHPWYLATPLILSVFTKYRFVWLWTFLVFLSYAAYGTDRFQEKYWLIGIEYLLVFSYFFYELFQKKAKPSIF